MIKIAFTGCGLGDFIYKNVDFNSVAFAKYKSKNPGDGGLTPGKLVFTEELEKFAGKNIANILSEIRGLKVYDTFNVGGPALVSCICTAQLLCHDDVEICYFGAFGTDHNGEVLTDRLHDLEFDTSNIIAFEGVTPYTTVLSDPTYNNDKGERTFINNIGAAYELTENHLTANFWNANILVFGGTALVPQLHNSLTDLLLKAKSKGALTVVTTVYDFINESKNPAKPWPLGDTLRSLPLIDLLIMDMEEAKRISGKQAFEQVTTFFKTKESSAFIITHGSEPSYLYSSGKKFEAVEMLLPVCGWLAQEFEKNPSLRGDTTGCGDNFGGATIANMAQQVQAGKTQLSLIDAAIMGTIGGGFACYTVGGVYNEAYSGQKIKKVSEMYDKYKATNAN